MSDNPYKTPEFTQPVTPPAGSSPYGPVRNLSGLASFSKVMLIISSVCTVGVSIYFMSPSFVEATTTGLETAEDVEQFNANLMLIGAVSIIMLILTAIAVCMWTSKAMANAWAHHKVKPTITPGWAAGWYFIPIAMLWKPYQATAEIWSAVYGRSKSNAILLTWWWCWILSGILDRISMKMGDTEDATVIDNISAVLTVIAAVFLIQIINKVTAYYNDRTTTPY